MSKTEKDGLTVGQVAKIGFLAYIASKTFRAITVAAADAISFRRARKANEVEQ